MVLLITAIDVTHVIVLLTSTICHTHALVLFVHTLKVLHTGLLQLPLSALLSNPAPHREAALHCLAAAARHSGALPPLELLFPFVAAALESPAPSASLAAACAVAAPAYAVVAVVAEQAEAGGAPDPSQGEARGEPEPSQAGARGCCEAVAGHALQWLEHAGLQARLRWTDCIKPAREWVEESCVLLRAVAAMAGFLLGMLPCVVSL